jgi:tetratricopeptide (TPR) repeat protein
MTAASTGQLVAIAIRCQSLEELKKRAGAARGLENRLDIESEAEDTFIGHEGRDGRRSVSAGDGFRFVPILRKPIADLSNVAGILMDLKDQSQLEKHDAERLDQALGALMAGDVRRAEPLLHAIIANTPDDYVTRYTTDAGLHIKFWDRNAFIHFVTWHQSRGTADQTITWIGNAYPRAHYYLGFLYVKLKQFDRAIEFLNRGMALEPTNPKFVCEKAQALVQSGRRREALELFDTLADVNENVSAHDVAIARRGRGFALVELGRLDEAEAAFHSSLELEPGNPVAQNELDYIAHLRSGGRASVTESVASVDPAASCAVCGRVAGEGRIIMVREAATFICRRCERRLTKKWWQFWK